MKSSLQIDPDNKIITSKQLLILSEINQKKKKKGFKHKYVLDHVVREIKVNVFFFKQFSFLINVKHPIIGRNFWLKGMGDIKIYF